MASVVLYDNQIILDTVNHHIGVGIFIVQLKYRLKTLIAKYIVYTTI
jgi:hypothetical protein